MSKKTERELFGCGVLVLPSLVRSEAEWQLYHFINPCIRVSIFGSKRRLFLTLGADYVGAWGLEPLLGNATGVGGLAASEMLPLLLYESCL